MKASVACVALCIACALFLPACSSAPENPAPTAETAKPPVNWQPKALGDVTEATCLFYGEGESFTDKAGGDIDLKAGASEGKCLGSRWGADRADFASYTFELSEPSESTLLVVKTAFDGTKPNPYEVLVDGIAVKAAEIEPSGGFGYTEKEWKCTSIGIGRIAQGRHTLTLKPGKNGAIVNIDCLALGKAK